MLNRTTIALLTVLTAAVLGMGGTAGMAASAARLLSAVLVLSFILSLVVCRSRRVRF